MKFLLTFLMIIPISGFSAIGTRGGGDLCEDRIKTIRNDISSWITNGGAKNLKLPNGLSIEEYEEEMQTQINKAQIRCVSSGDIGHPVAIDGIAKVCVFDIGTKENLITCDYNKFQAISESDQYVLIHHEYAGLSEIEKPTGADSDYSISNQISGYLVDHKIKKLAIKKPSSPGEVESTDIYSKIDKMFEDGKAPHLQSFKNWYSGRCYLSYRGNKAAAGLLIPLVFLSGTDNGPEFPNPEALRFAVFIDPNRADSFDNWTKDEISSTERSTFDVLASSRTAILEDNAYSVKGSSFEHRIREYKGYLIYKSINNHTPSSNVNCYFFKILKKN